MKKISVLIFTLLLSFPTSLLADEGMWFLMHIERLNQRDMQKIGLQLTAEEIYSINNQSLKDAIIQFNGGPKQYDLDREQIKNYESDGYYAVKFGEQTQFFQVISIENDKLIYSAYTTLGTLYDKAIITKDFLTGQKTISN